MPRRSGEHHNVVDGDLAHIERNGNAAPKDYSNEDRYEFYAMLKWIAREHGYKDGWSASKYKEKFGDWPRYGNGTPKPPSPEISAWVRSRNIAWAKSRNRQAA